MYDVMIIGAGPAGMSAALYTARAGLKTLVAEKFPVTGGQMNLTDIIENFPAHDPSDGMTIASLQRAQAENAGAEFICTNVTKIIPADVNTVETDDGVFTAKAVIYAAGAVHRKLSVEGEERLAGRGVSYCAVCDGGFYKGKTVAVIGGGDTALKEALYLSRLCERVYLIHRRDEFRGVKYLLEKCEDTENIEIIRSAVCKRIIGENRVTGLLLSERGNEREISCDGVFAAVGMTPVTELLKGVCELDKNGYVIAGEDCITSRRGIFAAGDVRTKPLRQIVTACSDGAYAAYSAEEYILRQHRTKSG